MSFDSIPPFRPRPPLAAAADGVAQAMSLLYGGTAVFTLLRIRQFLNAPDTSPDRIETLLWPVAWVRLWPFGATGLFVALTAVGLYAGFSWRRRSVRIGVAVLYLMQAAYLSSFGKVNHNDHMLVWTLILLAVPSTAAVDRRTARDRRDLIVAFWRAQCLVCLFYFLAGLWKLIAGCVQFVVGEPNLFRLDAMPRHLAARLLQTHGESSVADWLIAHPAVATPLLWGAVAIELLSIVVPFRPRLHRVWGVLLIGLHLGIGLAMTIWFDATFLVITVLLVLSPLRPATDGAKANDSA